MKDQFVANVVHFNIKHYQMYIHQHATHVEEVVKAYRQVHGFNDGDHCVIF
jgi:hypothetical protein